MSEIINIAVEDEKMSSNQGKKKMSRQKKEKVYIVKGKPFYKNIWFYMSLILLFNLVISKSTGKNNSTVEKSKSAKTIETSSSIEQKNDSQNNQTPIKTEVEYKAEVSTKGFMLKLNEVGETEEIRESEFTSYKSDTGKYALINIYIKNISDKLERIDTGSFKLVYNEKKYSPSRMFGLSNDYINFETLNPEMDMSGNLVFEVPKDILVQDCTLKFSATGLFEEALIFKLK